MELDTLREFIRQGKGPTVDWFPQDVSVHELAAALVALANGAGGTVLVGLTPDSGRPQGLNDPEAALDIAVDAALSAAPPLIIPLPQVMHIDGRALVCITVPPGLPHVYSLAGQYLVRDGSRNRPTSPRALRRLMLARGELNWEAHTPDAAARADLDGDAVAAYVEGLDGVGDASPDQVLLRRGCLARRGEELVPTFAGLLLFGRDPQRWVRGAEIEAARFGSREMSEIFVRQTIGGTLPQQLQRAEAFLHDHARSVVRMGAGLARQERPEYPPEAAREALVNAVAHRDYSITGDQIRVFLFSDRLQVTSPGRLPGPVTVDNIAEERFSRNEVIVQVLADMGFIERLGYGIDRMIRLMREYELPQPQFEETAGGFRVTLASAIDAVTTPAPLPDLSDLIEMGLNPRQEQALVFLFEQRRITSRDFQNLCPDVHPETLRRDLADLAQRDIVLKVGDKRATYYILKSPVRGSR